MPALAAPPIPARQPTASAALAAHTMAEHSASLLATARRHSLCDDDADDALQSGAEIFLRRAGNVTQDPSGWLRAVVRNEARSVRNDRLRLVGPAPVDLDGHEARELTGLDERADDREVARRRAKALARLKPDEARALTLQAAGYSYRELAQLTGWTRTKVNRCLTEGRRALMARMAEMDMHPD